MGKEKFTYVGREVSISTDFDNGALARVEEEKTNIFDLWPYEDEEYRDGYIYLRSVTGTGWDLANFCFHFRLEGCKGKEIEFRFHIKEREKEGDVSIVYANPDFPVYSYDGNHWMRMENKSLSQESLIEGGQTISVRQTYTKETAYIAYQYPYSNSHLESFVQRALKSPFCRVETAGESTEGRPIKQISITDYDVPIKEKKVVWFIGLQHPAELGAGWGLEGIIDYLLSGSSVAKKARENFIFNVIPIVNVDSVAEGRGRIHSSGRNLNREWERPDPVLEIRTIKRRLDEWKAEGNPIDIFIDFHGFSSRDGRWHLALLPEDAYTGKQKTEYSRLVENIKERIPTAASSPDPSFGYAAGAACRRYKALSMSIDGWVYPWLTEEGKTPDLSTYYELGKTICSLEEIKSCGAEFVKALVKFLEES